MAVKETTSVRVDRDAKYAAQRIFKEIGITFGEAVNMFLHQVRHRKGLPFAVEIPNRKTRKVLRDVQDGRNIEEVSVETLRSGADAASEKA